MILTLDDSFPHEVVVHGLCHDLGHFHAVELDEGVAFAVAGLHIKRLDYNCASISKRLSITVATLKVFHRFPANSVGTWVLSPCNCLSRQ